MPTPRPKTFSPHSPDCDFLAAAGIVVGHWQSSSPATIGSRCFTSRRNPYRFVLLLAVGVRAQPRLRTHGNRAASRAFSGRALSGASTWSHIACLAVAIALLPKCRHIVATAPDVFFVNLFLLQSWRMDCTYISAFNPPSWSISTDLFCYLCFPLLIRNWRATWLPKLGCAFVILAAVLWLTRYLSPLGGALHSCGWDGILCTSPFVRLFEFVIGMTLYLGWTRLSARWRPGFAAATCLELLAVALVFALMWRTVRVVHAIDQCVPLPDTATYWLLEGGIALPTNALLIGVMAFQGGLIARILSARLPVFLGDMSYSTYMVHYPLLLWWLPLFGSTGGSAALYFLATMATACLIWVFVENPSRKLRPLCWLRCRSPDA